MTHNINHMYFETKEEAMKFTEALLDLSLTSDERYCDIHMYPEEHAVIVEWEQVPYNHEYGGHFEYVDDDNDEQVMLWREFPDKHYDYFSSEEEFDEALETWLKENQGWARDRFGHWVNEKEEH